jgi:tetratricopeptide (TPR) repeat protein
MKINKDQNPITPQILRNDADFWDWYVRRLLKDKAFRRDFPAQKSFSKLRAAIAGLYSHTGRYRESEQAFREAVLLYPASPEASFRYIQEVLMPLRKWNTVEDILDYTDRVDPNNTRTKAMRGYMERMRSLTEQIGALQAKAAKSGLSATENIILAGCFLQLGQTSPARNFTKKALESKDANFECFYRGSQIYTQCGLRGDAAQAAKRALDMLPPNAPPHFRKDLALLLIEGGMATEAKQIAGNMPQDAFINERHNAQIIWNSNDAYLTYAIANSYACFKKVTSISFSLEICAEAYGYNHDFPSDITFSVNGVELATYTCKGDFGDRYGKYTPTWWFVESTKYGELVTVSVTDEGVYINDKLVNRNVSVRSLNLSEGNRTEIKIEVKEDAVRCGGFNIFGEKFGDYNQHIVFSANYD